MSARLQLVNTALAHIGEPGFASLDIDPPPSKLTKCLAQLDGPAGVVDWVLRRHPWLCAMAYDTLQADERSGGWKFPYVYVLPDEEIRVWEVQDTNGCAVAYEAGVDVIDGATVKVIRSTSAGPLNAAWTERKPLDGFTADVLNIMGFELAARVEGPIQEKMSKGPTLHQKAVEMIAIGQGAEAGEYGGGDVTFAGGFAQLRQTSA